MLSRLSNGDETVKGGDTVLGVRMGKEESFSLFLDGLPV